MARPYESELRARQAATTRERILDALVTAMSRGLASLSIPAVAREAGVSTQTIYRHFGSKAGLLEALAPHVATKAGLLPDSPAGDLGDFVRDMFEHLEGLDDELRAAMASQLGSEVRRVGMPLRRARAAQIVRERVPHARPDDVARAADLLIALMSSSTYRLLRQVMGLDLDATVDRVTWAAEAMLSSVADNRDAGAGP